MLKHMDVVAHRETKYCTAIRQAVAILGHPTNSMLLHYLRAEFPDLTATTVHRVTARLAERGEIGVAPSTKIGAVRYDADTSAHDHFRCTVCDKLCDANIKDKIVATIKTEMKDCRIPGNIILSGICKDCG